MIPAIHLGYKVGSGEPIAIPLRHMAITGQTQESGKTTTLEALVSRAATPVAMLQKSHAVVSQLRAIAFITKRGEGSFRSGRRIAPYFQERADWEYVESILEAVMKQRMKLERAWILRATRGARTLDEVRANAAKAEAKAKGGMNQDMYMLLGEYLDKVVPLIRTLPKSAKLELAAGLNVMDLVQYPLELQYLVIASALEWIHEHEQGVVCIVPEAWKFMPQGRRTPVFHAVQSLVREGAGLRNYVWVDSQDMAGVEKLVLRACAVWLIGVQREANELKRALDNMPAGLQKPKPEAVATLDVGEFYACFGKTIAKTYVQPAWLPEGEARRVAMGEVKPAPPPRMEEPTVNEAEAQLLRDENTSLRSENTTLTAQVDTLRRRLEALVRAGRGQPAAGQMTSGGEAAARRVGEADSRRERNGAGDAAAIAERELGSDFEATYQLIKSRLLQEAPALLLKVTKVAPEIEVTVKRETLAMTTETLDGRMAVLLADGFFDTRKSNTEVREGLAARGWPEAPPNISKSFGRLTRMGFLRDVGGRYQAVEGVKARVVEG